MPTCREARAGFPACAERFQQPPAGLPQANELRNPWFDASDLAREVHVSLREVGEAMLTWASVFLALALSAAAIGFGAAPVILAPAAKLLFYIAVLLCVMTLIGHVMRRI